MRIEMGVDTVPFFSSGASFVALILVFLIFHPPDDGEAQPKNMREVAQGMWMAMTNGRFFALILITAGFWAIQGQLYASMPDYVLRMAGETYKPEWYANINPLVVVIFVVWITHIVRKWKPHNSILVAMLMIFGHRIGLTGLPRILVVVAIAISVVLANMGARNIARPISELSSYLKRYADGDHRSIGTRTRWFASCGTASVRYIAIRPSPPPRLSAPCQITSPDAHSSSSIAGW